jgi:hypothetical protein
MIRMAITAAAFDAVSAYLSPNTTQQDRASKHPTRPY